MTFAPEHIERFRSVFNSHWKTIAGFEGCTHLELFQDQNDPQVFFTYSHWNTEQDLENYRQSDFFRGVWGQTKTYFSAPPQAWSVKKMDGMPHKPIA
jgi:quinol monooxygenase YgiN